MGIDYNSRRKNDKSDIILQCLHSFSINIIYSVPLALPDWKGQII